ncbi:hypothetical protein SPOG_04785 [Schizosaccharomyces cryophilus OY26]|uniref:Uncharacterized protein n=1 Tax=Schizosaccharomyces cryophilus (strain OY26 / ATCC MYA-4695 / CBS 11777 / NBRC 106824 / NRRL Y48691) TaxID=653667 RepID=S9W0Z9_SCHCR|nr:uncharacterized protein SPOG_04785 [Schizosaccharomyces cryophilus OY26]EPY52129.1 hypothetical protein SPOG_04785 [Schizosaccharomyces cryophilus OY26]
MFLEDEMQKMQFFKICKEPLKLYTSIALPRNSVISLEVGEEAEASVSVLTYSYKNKIVRAKRIRYEIKY